MKPRNLRRYVNLWPPMLFSGIRVEHLGDDWRSARVRLKLRWYNRNYVGTQFGGSLFSMVDPWWMILVMECLGRDYVVWDQAGEISGSTLLTASLRPSPSASATHKLNWRPDLVM